MALSRLLRPCLVGLLGVGLMLGSAGADVRKKKKGAQTDPMEAESNPQGPSSTPSSGSGDPGSGQSTTSSPSSGGSSSGSSGGGGSSSSSSGGGGGGATVQTEKVGRFMFNLKIGPSLCAYFAAPGMISGSCNGSHMGALVLDFGWSVLPNKNAYVLFPLQFQFRPDFSHIIVPVGFQYDIALPVKGLYVYPRAFIGYVAALSKTLSGQSITSHLGVFTPEFGVKYIFGGRWNVGAELFSLPMYFNTDGAQIFYRILFYGGANF